MAIIRPVHDREVCDRCRELRLQEAMLPTEPRTSTLGALEMRAWHRQGQPDWRARFPPRRSEAILHRWPDDDDPELLWGDPPR